MDKVVLAGSHMRRMLEQTSAPRTLQRIGGKVGRRKDLDVESDVVVLDGAETITHENIKTQAHMDVETLTIIEVHA